MGEDEEATVIDSGNPTPPSVNSTNKAINGTYLLPTQLASSPRLQPIPSLNAIQGTAALSTHTNTFELHLDASMLTPQQHMQSSQIPSARSVQQQEQETVEACSEFRQHQW